MGPIIFMKFVQNSNGEIDGMIYIDDVNGGESALNFT